MCAQAPGTGRAWLSVSISAVLAGISIAGWWYVRPPVNDLAARLNAARATRATAGRLSLERTWAPAAAASRGGVSPTLSPDLLIACAHAQQALERVRNASTLGTYATAELLLNHVDSAVSLLDEATRLAPRDASAWSDLAAACYARTLQPSGGRCVAHGLDAADTALSLSSGDPEARFNRALLLEAAGLRDQARDAWNAYLSVDDRSGWADEARHHLAAPRRVADDLGAARDALFDDVLKRWGDAVLAHDTDRARASLRQAGEIVERLQAAPDDLARHALEAVRDAPSPAQAFLARGHVHYGAGRRLYSADRFEEAAVELEAARQDFDRAGSAAVHLTRLYQGIVRYRQHDNAAALTELARLRERMGEQEYPAIAGRALWVEGLIQEASGRSFEARRSYSRAVAMLTRARETANAAFVDVLFASLFDHIGDPVRAWDAMVTGLAADSRQGTLLTAAILSESLGYQRAALEFDQAAVKAARSAPRRALLVDALRRQALAQAALGQTHAARLSLAEARDIANGQSGVAWQRLDAELDAATAALPALSSAGDARAAATRAIEFFRRTSTWSRLPGLLLARAASFSAEGALASAQADLLEGLSISATLRRNLGDSVDEITYADVLRRLVSALVDVDTQLGRLDDAFAAVDAARGVDVSEAPAAPLTLDAIRARVPPDTAIVEFVVGASRTFAWVIGPGSTWVVSAPGRRQIEPLVAAAGPPRFDRAAAASLRQLLLRDVEARLPPGALLVLVPDGPLHAVPFASLPAADGSYLIERHPLLVAPSARSWLDASARLRGFAALPTHVFATGSPRIDPVRYPGLSALPFAEMEAAAVAATYASGVCVTGADVNRDAVLRHLDTEVVHFAGHALVNDLRPLESELLLSDADGPGLTAATVRRLSCRNTRLVVLGACQTAGGRGSESEGPISLARAFLEAGAPTVVAARWDIDDRASSDLLVSFHREFARTADAARALQHAQVEAIHKRGNADRATWAAFVAFGGSGAGVGQLTRAE